MPKLIGLGSSNSILVQEYITKSIKMYVSTFEDKVNKKGIIVPDECLELTLEQMKILGLDS